MPSSEPPLRREDIQDALDIGADPKQLLGEAARSIETLRAERNEAQAQSERLYDYIQRIRTLLRLDLYNEEKVEEAKRLADAALDEAEQRGTIDPIPDGDGECYECGDDTSSISARPSRWPVTMVPPNPDEPGKTETFHRGCYYRAVRHEAFEDAAHLVQHWWIHHGGTIGKANRQFIACANAVRDLAEHDDSDTEEDDPDA